MRTTEIREVEELFGKTLAELKHVHISTTPWRRLKLLNVLEKNSTTPADIQLGEQFVFSLQC